MNIVERFINTELVYCNYWFKDDTPETAARKCIESTLLLHHFSNTYTGDTPYVVGLNLESLLRVMVKNYLFDDVCVYRLTSILNRELLYTDNDIDWLLSEMCNTDCMWMKLTCGCILKIIIPYKPDMSIISEKDNILSDLAYIMTKSRLKKIICSPDSEIYNDQFGAKRFLTRMLAKYKACTPYTYASIIALVCDTIILAYVQRVTKFKDLRPYFKQLSIDDFLT